MPLRHLLALAALTVMACASGFPKRTETSRGVWSSVCPERMEDVAVGSHCADRDAFASAPDTRPMCDYSDGFCECTPTQQGYAWTCKADPAASACPYARRGVPFEEGAACPSLGQTCSYTTDDCESTFTCAQTGWRMQSPACPDD